MDLYCPKRGCGEPVENDELHEAVEGGLFDNYTAALRAFQSKGCEVLNLTHSTGNTSMHADVASVMYDLLGDDADGAAALMEDFGYFGMLR